MYIRFIRGVAENPFLPGKTDHQENIAAPALRSHLHNLHFSSPLNHNVLLPQTVPRLHRRLHNPRDSDSESTMRSHVHYRPRHHVVAEDATRPTTPAHHWE